MAQWWRVRIWISPPVGRAEDGHWETCCLAYGTEMCALVCRALEAAGQRVQVLVDD